MSSGITGCGHYQLVRRLLQLLTIVHMLLGRSTSSRTLLIEVDTIVVVVVSTAAAAADAAIIIIVQITVGGRHRLATASSNGRISNIVPMHLMALRFAFLFHLQLFAQDGGNFALHEGPRYRRVGQRALLATRAVHLGARALSLDALAATGEAELVVPDRGTLHEVGVFQPFLAEGTLERGIRCGSRGRSTGRAIRRRSVDSWRRSGSGWSWSNGATRSTGTGRSGWSGNAIWWRLRTGLWLLLLWLTLRDGRRSEGT